MKYLHILSICSLVLAGCHNGDSSNRISTEDVTAESVFLTRDQNDNPVVVWTEKKDDALTIFLALAADDGSSIGEKIGIPLTTDVTTHPESMPKVAFKNDGTIIAAYEKKSPTKENKYASAVYYIMSEDGGKSWSKQTFLHRDTTAGMSRSYFDIARLPDGEIGASWLDVKMQTETGGRSVRFARTSPSGGFGHEVLIDSSACQCCRIDVYTDDSDNVFVAYRGIMKGNVGRQIRDMMIATSTDLGVTFSNPITISADNWNIEGCPHTGPSLCSNKAGLISMWYTEGSGTGIYYAQKPENGTAFSERQLVSSNGHHPQLSANNDYIAMLWEENVEEHGQMTTVIYCRLVKDGANIITKRLTPEHSNAFVPVTTPTTTGFLVAYLMEQNGYVGVFLETLNP